MKSAAAQERHRRRNKANANIKGGRHPREVLFTVSNEALRHHYLMLVTTGQATATSIAYGLGWTSERDGKPQADTGRLKRNLGLAESSCMRRGERIRYVLQEIDYKVAEQMCLAMGGYPPAMNV